MTGPVAASDALLARMMTLHPKIIDLTLDRVWRLLEALDHPERALPPVIHIAGTNGKGSTLAMIRAGLETEGARVHAYTSPHLVRFHERIRVAGALIPEAQLAALLDECLRANGPAPITYFEITTCAALLAFARQPADVTLLEVGLGGRLDATNVIARPALCVITPVSLDHQQYLGTTISAIAAEKAGILKPGVPCIVSAQMPAAREVIEDRAAVLNAPLLIEGQDWQARIEAGRLIYEDGDGLLDLPPPNLPGPHQVQNAGAALAALRALGHCGAPEAVVTRAEWPARMQRLRTGPLCETLGGAPLWLDGGHNPAAGQAIGDTLKALAIARVHLICGMLSTKDVAGFLAPLAPFAASFQAVGIPGEAAALPAGDIAAHARSLGMVAQASLSLDAAVAQVARDDPGAHVLICGSLYLAGQVLRDHR